MWSKILGCCRQAYPQNMTTSKSINKNLKRNSCCHCITTSYNCKVLFTAAVSYWEFLSVHIHILWEFVLHVRQTYSLILSYPTPSENPHAYPFALWLFKRNEGTYPSTRVLTGPGLSVRSSSMSLTHFELLTGLFAPEVRENGHYARV